MTDSSLAASPAILTEVLHRAAFAALPGRAFLRITGPDATRWLNGMVTNSTQSLAPGQGNYNFLLNAQGRIQGDCLIFRDPAAGPDPEFLLVTDASQIETLQPHLDRFIIMDDVELTRAHQDETTLLLLGPDAPQLLTALDLPLPGPLHLAHADTPHGPTLLLTPPPGQVPRFELRAATAIIQALQTSLTQRGLPEASPSTLEHLRILEARPRFGADITDKYLPQETGQSHALHFAKGCYLGQEIVERIRSRGQVHRLLTSFRLEGSVPDLPAPLQSAGKPAGELTSAAEIPLETGPAILALGYARRELIDTRAPLTYPGGAAHLRSTRAPG